ncbi:hypothetical protein EBI00_02460 [Marinomonas hwangdonensis]|uniref:Peptidase M15A C-terminal domain-containing protein n=1 Tax=Marinomonas hwangdonensis TaxID=1053647 RepID=A0A3M8QBF5_9GAMM|nr:D-Ala-D-Ala carboxypeptidase family metallohydrolase [Marinomonas hwangdonensis]RNF52982.1 hypothetical protein EBI00_02460 [Marinomonas hwangdonensis]
MTEIPFFSKTELECKGSGVVKLDPHFAIMLPALRLLWGHPLSPSSVCRTPEHNAKVGGHPRSLHLTENPTHNTKGCAAADIRWRNWDDERKLAFARLAYSLGFSVGLHDGFCHVDWRQSANLEQSCFLYGAWSGSFYTNEVTS